jgi:hypothetical protein
VTKAARNPPRHGRERSLSLAVRIASGILTGPRARKRRPPRHFPRISRLYPQRESCRKSPDRERRGARASRTLFWHRDAPDHVVNDSAECHGDRSLGFGEHRSNDLIDQGRAVRQRIGIFSGNGGAQDIVGRNASALPAKLIATVRTPDTFQDAVTNEGLQDRLKMPWGEPVPGREHRASPCIDGNVNTATMARRPLRDINGIWGTTHGSTRY